MGNPGHLSRAARMAATKFFIKTTEILRCDLLRNINKDICKTKRIYFLRLSVVKKSFAQGTE